MGGPDPVIKELEKTLVENPENYNARIELATQYMTKGDYYSAAAELQRAVRANPPAKDTIEAYYQLGMVLRTLGNFQEALKCFEKVIEIDNGNGNALYYSGLLNAELGNPQKAVDALKRSIEILPQQSYLHYALGSTEMQLGNNDRAIDEFRKALELTPKDIQIRNTLGLAYLKKKSYGEAAKELKESFQINPKDPTSVFLFAWVNMKQEKEIQSLELMEKFVSGNTSHVLGHFALSALHSMVGEYAEGKESYQKGIDIIELHKDPATYSALQIISTALVEISDEKEIMEEEEAASKPNLAKAFQEIMGIKDHLLRDKGKLISKLSRKMAEISQEFDENEIEDIEIAGMLCNLGMALLPDSIVNKEEKLTDEERKVLNTHPLLSVKALESINVFSEILPFIKHHHERFNGTGYPGNLKGEDIPLGASILGITDFYAELTLGGKRQKPAPQAEAINAITTLKGNFFSKKAVDLLTKAISQY